MKLFNSLKKSTTIFTADHRTPIAGRHWDPSASIILEVANASTPLQWEVEVGQTSHGNDVGRKRIFVRLLRRNISVTPSARWTDVGIAFCHSSAPRANRSACVAPLPNSTKSSSGWSMPDNYAWPWAWGWHRLARSSATVWPRAATLLSCRRLSYCHSPTTASILFHNW